jgi:pimeloyl-ACP methyl ester carboxylesterase
MTEFLDAPGGRIAYDVTGEGPLVLLAPGMGDVRQAYRFLAPKLREASYRVATMDLRGHGQSSVGWDSYTRTDSASDILALIRHLGGPAIVIGHSFAGGSAVIAAAQQPSLLNGMVLIDPGTRTHKVNPILMAAFSQIVRSPTLWGVYYRYLNPKVKPADFGAYLTALKANLRQPGRMAATTAMGRSVASDAEAALAHARRPTLIVMGGNDPDFPDPQAEADAIAAALPDGAQIAMIKGAGHYPHAQFPAEVAAAVLPFLKEHAGA